MTQANIGWLPPLVVMPDNAARQSAVARQAILTKPAGALGQLEEIAIRLAALQGQARPIVDVVHITVFAADHGVAMEGVSAFGQAVTGEMVKNFSKGGAAISVLARQLGAKLEVITLGMVNNLGPLPGVLHLSLGPGTENFCQKPAMQASQLVQALQIGKQAVKRAQQVGTQLFIGGEMGIGNSTSAAALACALLQASPTQLAGPGTGLDPAGVAHKIQVIHQALDRHQRHLNTPLEALRRLGGFEIAALVGAYLACAEQGLPVLVDGFISSIAALAATHLCPEVKDWFLFSHTSAEPGHQMVLRALVAKPLLDLGMRLGEGSGAAVAVPLLRLACALHNEMATFKEAGISDH